MSASPTDRAAVRRLIATHQPFDADEARSRSRMLRLLDDPRCFLRERLDGHFTASALITDSARTRILLVHHRKLGRWLPPGGHCDGRADLAGTALRETTEETGLRAVRLVDPAPFDLDVHPIPARPDTPAHLHYDAVFRLIADPAEPLAVSEESFAVAWAAPDDPRIEPTRRMRRMLERLYVA